MKPDQAKNFTIVLGLVSFVPAIFMSGALGNGRPEGGSGFWVFLGYILPLLTGFVLVNHFAAISAERKKSIELYGRMLLITTGVAMIFSRQLKNAADPLLGMISDYISYAWYLGPIALLLNAFCSNAR